MNPHIQKILFSPFFLFGLFLLLLNDFYLKAEFHNFLTGKLSDVTGLFIFPLFFSAFFPKRKLEIYILTGVLFVFWKLPFSQFLINFWNSFEFFRVNRVADFTHFIALFVLPVSYLFLISTNNQKPNYLQLVFFKRLATSGIILISVFAFTATSYENDRQVWIDKKYELNMNIIEFENTIKNTKSFEISKFEKKTEAFPPNKYPNVKADPNGYYLHFDLKKGYCESKKLRIFISLKFENKILIDSAIVRYWCKNPPNDEDEENITAIFESEVIEKLRQNNPQ